MQESRLTELDKIEAAINECMRREIAHLQHRALELEAEERAGKPPRLNSESVRRQAEALTDRLERRPADIAPLPPEVCGAALVVPAILLREDDADEEAVDGLRKTRTRSAAPKSRPRRWMRSWHASVALDCEPFDVSSENRGYDIESRDLDTGGLRFIEVKGRRGDADAITITQNKMLVALNAGTTFILAVVLVEDGFIHQPLYVPNPASLFGAEPGFNEVHRAISVASIKAAAQGDAEGGP